MEPSPISSASLGSNLFDFISVLLYNCNLTELLFVKQENYFILFAYSIMILFFYLTSFTYFDYLFYLFFIFTMVLSKLINGLATYNLFWSCKFTFCPVRCPNFGDQMSCYSKRNLYNLSLTEMVVQVLTMTVYRC